MIQIIDVYVYVDTFTIFLKTISRIIAREANDRPYFTEWKNKLIFNFDNLKRTSLKNVCRLAANSVFENI